MSTTCFSISLSYAANYSTAVMIGLKLIENSYRYTPPSKK